MSSDMPHRTSVVLHPDEPAFDTLVTQPQKPLARVKEVPAKTVRVTAETGEYG